MKYILNPYYALKNDKKRILLSNAPSFKVPEELAEEGFMSFIHPIYAVILSSFDGKKDLKKVINEIAETFEEEIDTIENIVLPFIENKSKIGFMYEDVFFEFPKRMLVENKDNIESRYSPQHFFLNEELDFTTQRLYTSSSDIRILINTKCATDCIYCYVDREVKDNCKIPFNKVKELIKEAKILGVNSFDIAGTEIFLYRYWAELIEELLKNGYYPYLSTKIPIGKKIIDKLYNFGIKDIQISIDTLVDEEIITVNKYSNPNNNAQKMLKTLKALEEKKFNVAINSVITKYNCGLDTISYMLNKLSEFNNISVVTLNIGEKSVYKSEENFLDFRVSLEEIEKIQNYCAANEDRFNFNVVVPSYTEKKNFINSYEDKRENFSKRSLCTAGIRQMCILPDGKVTICEELYWHPKFIIGNVLNNSIKEIWNSSEALSLVHPSQNNFSSDTVCKSCNNFEICRMGAGVCYSDIISLYGEDKWDFPSPECPKAPKPNYISYFE